ncbi:MAG: hypothetical protein E7510_10430 [Ruminococcus sp.]|nr:hypothetical protein [Ruminococcus sp.]
MNERIKVIRAMETIARCVNDENQFMLWLNIGIADGDVKESTTDEELEYYAEDEEFSDLMDTFLLLMSKAYKNGGLYCDGVVSK